MFSSLGAVDQAVTAFRLLCHDHIVAIHLQAHRLLGSQAAGEHGAGQRILDLVLDRPPDWPCAEGRVETDAGDVEGDLVVPLEAEAPLGQTVTQNVELQRDDLLDLVPAEGI